MAFKKWQISRSQRVVFESSSGTICSSGDVEGRPASGWFSSIRRHIVDADRGAIGQDDPLPHHERAFLAERHDTVVAADQARALRDQENPPGHAVLDILRHLRGGEPRQVGVQPGDEAGADDTPAITM